MKKKDNEINERFLDMADKSPSITGIFAQTQERTDELTEIVKTIADNANRVHREECKEDGSCEGVQPYCIKSLKSYFILHPELDEMDRLGITSSLFYSMGSVAGKNGQDPIDRVMERMVSIPMPASFGEMMAEMIGEQDEGFMAFKNKLDTVLGKKPNDKRSLKELIDQKMKDDADRD